MKKLVLLSLVFALLLTACSNWSIEIKDPQSRKESGAESSVSEGNGVDISEFTVFACESKNAEGPGDYEYYDLTEEEKAEVFSLLQPESWEKIELPGGGIDSVLSLYSASLERALFVTGMDSERALVVIKNTDNSGETELYSVPLEVLEEAKDFAYAMSLKNGVSTPDIQTAVLEKLCAAVPEWYWYNNVENTGIVLDYGDLGKVDAPVEFSAEWGSTGYGGYVSPSLTALIYGGVPEMDNNPVTVIISRDMGKTWETSTINTKDKNGATFVRKYIGFTSDSEGWAVLPDDTDKCYVYMTHDGGKTWEEAGNPNEEYSAGVSYAKFITEETGFVCYTYKTETEPVFYKTTDGGKTWARSAVTIPAEYRYDYATPYELNYGGGICALRLLAVDHQSEDSKSEMYNLWFFSTDEGESWEFYKFEP